MSKSRKNRGWTPIPVPDVLFFAREAAEEPVLYAFRSEEERALWVEEGAAPVGPPRRWALSRKASRWIEGWDRLDALARGDGWPATTQTILRMVTT